MNKTDTKPRSESAEVVKHEDVAAVMERTGERFDLSEVGDPTAGLETARKLVSYMANRCTGPEYIAEIQGKRFPKVDWWTTVGGGLGLFPREESCRKLERPNEVAYEATVGVYNGDQLVTRASAICSSKESTWSGRDEYAIRSMAITRATGKAYRVGLSFLPVMAGLEPTPAEEMPGQRAAGGGGQQQTSGADTSDLRCPDCDGDIWDNRDDDKSAANGGKRPNFKCKDRDGCNWASWDSEDETFGGSEEFNWADPLEDFPELLNALAELEGLNEKRAANARLWLEKHTDTMRSSPQALSEGQERVEQAIAEERGETDESGDEDEVQKEDRNWVEATLGDYYGDVDTWDAKLRMLGTAHPHLKAEWPAWDAMSWNTARRFIEEHEKEGVEHPHDYVPDAQGELV